MNEQHVKIALMHLCKPSVLDSDFNVVAFHALCDRLKEIGATKEREACAKVCDEVAETYGDADECATEIRARGNK